VMDLMYVTIDGVVHGIGFIFVCVLLVVTGIACGVYAVYMFIRSRRER